MFMTWTQPLQDPFVCMWTQQTECCCRCYELRCVNSVVPSNYSSDNIPIPYNISANQLTPVYAFATYNNSPPLDDYGRPFPGNVLAASNTMFTQCWNQTQDAQVRFATFCQSLQY